MTRSLKFQGRYFAGYLGILALLLGVFIPYAMLTSSSQETLYIVYRVEAFMVTFLLSFMYALMFANNMSELAISFGATRRDWFLSLLLVKLAFVVLCTVLVCYIMLPLSNLAFGFGFSVMDFGGVLVSFTVFLFGASYGSLMGYVAARKGTKFMLLLVAALFLAILGLFVAGLGLFDEDILLRLANSWGIAALLAALCVPAELAGWQLAKRVAVH